MLLVLIFTLLFIFAEEIALGQFSGRNVALNKPAFQYPGDLCLSFTGLCYGASLAVDGAIDGAVDWAGHCSHTTEQIATKAFWTVNFTDLYHITGIIVYNRISTVAIGKRLRDFILYGINSEQSSERLLYIYDNYTFASTNYQSKIEIPLPDKPYVSGIKIEIPYRGQYEDTVLTLCEVEVFSEDAEDYKCPQLKLNTYTFAFYTNKTYNGSIVTFTCVEGYEIQEDYNLICQGKNWNRNSPECQVVYCQFQPEIPNGHYIFLTSCSSNKTIDRLPFNCSIQPNCDTGYQLERPTIRSCLETKQWSEEEPVCESVRCNFSSFQHGSYMHSNGSAITQDFIDYGTLVHVTCEIGYISDTKTRTCQNNGTLDGTDPECTRITCDHPGIVLHGHYINKQGNIYMDGQMTYLQPIQIQCNKGYKIESNSVTRICQHNGLWSGTNAVCIVVTCQPLEIVQNISYEYSNENASQNYPFATTVQIHCEYGMVANGSIIRNCTDNGAWSGIFSYCNSVKCDYPGKDSDLNGYFTDVFGNPYTSGQMNFSQIIQLRCKKGYKIPAESNTRACQHDGLWSGINSQCTIVTCPALETIHGQNYDYSNYTAGIGFSFGSEVTIRCADDSLQTGSNVRRCTEECTWDGTPSTCKQLCPLPAVTNGELLFEDGTATSQTQFTENTKLFLSCKPGYHSLQRVPVLTCLNNKTWNGISVCNQISTKEVDHMRNSAIIGGVLGTVIVLFVAAGIAHFVRKLRFQQKEEREAYNNLQLSKCGTENEYDSVNETNLTA